MYVISTEPLKFAIKNTDYETITLDVRHTDDGQVTDDSFYEVWIVKVTNNITDNDTNTMAYREVTESPLTIHLNR